MFCEIFPDVERRGAGAAGSQGKDKNVMPVTPVIIRKMKRTHKN